MTPRSTGRVHGGRGLPRLAGAVALAIASMLLVGCGDETPASAAPNGVAASAQRGRELIKDFGCGSCHTIPGIDNADAMVGPPLTAWRRRIYIAGLLRNTPDNLRIWIQHPQQIVPNNAMPDMGITARQAQDIATYLLTLQ